MMTGNSKAYFGKRIFLSMLVAALCSAFFPAQPTRAQSQMLLAVEPGEMEVPLGNSVVLALNITLGLNVNAFDLTVEYDPEVLSFEKWENGDYLKNLATVKEVDDPGTFRLAATQLAQPDVSGDGALIVLTFNSEGAGESAINLVDVAFADSQGNKAEPETVDGMVAVTLSPTYTPTPTPTHTPTTKPTLTPTLGSDGGTVYPVKGDVSATPTTMLTDRPDEGTSTVPAEGEMVGTTYSEGSAYPSGMTGQDETAAAYPRSGLGSGQQDTGSLSVDDEQSAGAEGEVQESVEPVKTGLGVFLWVILIIALLAIAVMVLIAIRRRNNKDEGLLL